MIRRVNAVLGWEASKEINSKTTWRCPQKWRASAGSVGPADTQKLTVRGATSS